MDIVLEKIHYNPEIFSKIINDFEEYVQRTEPGFFQKVFDDLKKSAIFSEEYLIFAKINTKKHGTRNLGVKKQPRALLE